jgi:adenylate cyclase
MISVSDSVSSSTHSGEYVQPLAGGTPYGDMRKAKSSMSMISLILKKSRSKNRLRVDSEAEHPSLRQSAPPLPDSSFASLLLAGPSPSSSPPKSTIKKDKKAGKRKATILSPPHPPRISLEQPEFRLDTNLYEMDGIIDPTILSGSSVGHEATSPGSGFDSSSMSHSHSDHSSHHGAASMTSPNFSNPFLPTPASAKRLPYALTDYRKVSPTTIVPPVGMVPPTPEGVTDPAWTAPESWAVEKEGEDPGEPEYSSSEDSLINGPGGRATSLGMNGNGRGSNTSSLSAIPPTVSTSSRRKSRRKTALKSQRQPSVDKTFKIRIYRANNSYHVVSIGLHVTVANLTPALNQRLLPTSERETHRLYLKERGRGESLQGFVWFLRRELMGVKSVCWRRRSGRQILCGGGWSKLGTTLRTVLRVLVKKT